MLKKFFDWEAWKAVNSQVRYPSMHIEPNAVVALSSAEIQFCLVGLAGVGPG